MTKNNLFSLTKF